MLNKLKLLDEEREKNNNNMNIDIKLLLKVLIDMNRIIKLVPENFDKEKIEQTTYQKFVGGKYKSNYGRLTDKYYKFKNEYYNLLKNKKNLKKVVNDICDKYSDNNKCINIIFETLEKLELNEQDLKKVDLELDVLKQNNIELINKKQIEIEELQKQIKLKNKDIKNIEIKLSNLLKKYRKGFNKRIALENVLNYQMMKKI